MDIRKLLIETGLKVDKEYANRPWQLWKGDSNGPVVRLLQANGTNPRVQDYSNEYASALDSRFRDNAGMVPRYIARIWWDDSLAQHIGEGFWYWLSKDSGQTFEKLRPMVIQDGGGGQKIKWTIYLGELLITTNF